MREAQAHNQKNGGAAAVLLPSRAFAPPLCSVRHALIPQHIERICTFATQIAVVQCLYRHLSPATIETPPRIYLREGSLALLKLKRVEIQGFKSFYDRTEMKFNGSGIAAIVGPNGCGKSNLSDAISWVLGEQSAKTLRGARMEDVIFAGTRDRKASGHGVGDYDAGAARSRRSGLVTRDRLCRIADEWHGNGHGPRGTRRRLKTAERSGEVTITRRLYRSGESEYLVNGKLARLARYSGPLSWDGIGPGKLRDHRAGAHRTDSEQ